MTSVLMWLISVALAFQVTDLNFKVNDISRKVLDFRFKVMTSVMKAATSAARSWTLVSGKAKNVAVVLVIKAYKTTVFEFRLLHVKVMGDLGGKVTRCGRRRGAVDDVDSRAVGAALPYCSRRRRQRHVEDGRRTDPAVARRGVESISQSVNQSISHPVIHAFSHSFIHAFTYSFFYSRIHSFIRAFNQSVIQSTNQSVNLSTTP